MATLWAPGSLHSKRKIRVFLHQEVLFDLVVHSVGVSEDENYTAQAEESVLNSEALGTVPTNYRYFFPDV